MKTQQKTEVLRARCDDSLKQDVSNIARLKMVDESDIVRIAVARFVEQFKAVAGAATLL